MIIKFLKQKGFTLLEALVAVTLVGVLGVILLGVISRSFQSSDKASLIGNIKQSGQVALEKMESEIRIASAIVCPIFTDGVTSVNSSSIIVQKQNGYTRFTFDTTTGVLKQDFPEFNDDCNVSEQNPLELINKQSSNIKVTNGTFTVYKTQNKQSVEIQFSLEPNLVSNRVEEQVSEPVEFRTTIQLR